MLPVKINILLFITFYVNVDIIIHLIIMCTPVLGTILIKSNQVCISSGFRLVVYSKKFNFHNNDLNQ